MDPLNLISQGRIKRYFRARRKVEAPGLSSHITQRAAGKEPLFVEEADYFYMLKLLKDVSRKFELRMFAFVLMSNHLHLLFQLRHKNLFQAMQMLFMQYAIFFNKKYERKGHLFGGPYRQAVCLDNSYLLASSIYIHLNPVRAGMVEHYSHYRWSTWKLYCLNKRIPTFVDYKFILRMLDSNLQQAMKDYTRKLEQAIEVEADEIYKDEHALHKFRDLLIKRFPDSFKKLSKKKGVSRISFNGYSSDVELENIYTRLRERKWIKKPSEKDARKFLIEQLLSRGFNKQEIAQKLNISRQTVHRTLS